MKRQALFIANLDAAGAQNDINNWKRFLRSGVGGAWREDEIRILTNPSKSFLEAYLTKIRSAQNDFVIVVYAGHGGWERSTILEINPNGETINETTLKGLAPREILTLDCCRATGSISDILNESQPKMFSERARSIIRSRYDARMMAAIPQQVTLYACGVGECAYCTSEGGYYTKNLLRQCASFPDMGFRTINQAHNAAATSTTEEVRHKENENQHPDISVARCLISQQLIIGIDTTMFRID